MSTPSILEKIRGASRHEQFLDVVSRDEAERCFRAAAPHQALATEWISLAEARGRIMAENLAAPIDLPALRSLLGGRLCRAGRGYGGGNRPIHAASAPQRRGACLRYGPCDHGGGPHSDRHFHGRRGAARR